MNITPAASKARRTARSLAAVIRAALGKPWRTERVRKIAARFGVDPRHGSAHQRYTWPERARRGIGSDVRPCWSSPRANFQGQPRRDWAFAAELSVDQW